MDRRKENYYDKKSRLVSQRRTDERKESYNYNVFKDENIKKLQPSWYSFINCSNNYVNTAIDSAN